LTTRSTWLESGLKKGGCRVEKSCYLQLLYLTPGLDKNKFLQKQEVEEGSIAGWQAGEILLRPIP